MKTLLLLSCLLLPAHVFPQVFPVHVTPQLTPPYSPYLTDYTAPGSKNLTVQVYASDLSLANYPFRLRITIEGPGITLRTRPDFVTRPLILASGGVPQVYYGDELHEYFDPDALAFSGYSKSEYARRARLPEGVYRFTAEVLDYYRGTVVSNAGTTTAWIILNDPPVLNAPSNFSTVKLSDPANILFSWTPRHTASPNAAFTTRYLFRLIEVWPENRNPYDALLTQPPLFETTTEQNHLLYGIAEPALLPGKKYAWQVVARDMEGRDLFRNQGRSAAFVFTFGEAVPAPENFRLRWAKPTTLSVRWDAVRAAGEETKYRLLYRPRLRREDHQWYETRTQFTEKTLYDLESNTEYEMKVRAENTLQESDYTPTRIFRTLRPEKEAFTCKEYVDPPPSPANTLPAFPMQLNDTLHAGGFSILVREVRERDGTYSGTGVAIIPWLNGSRVRVSFNDIRVNDRYWLTSGTVSTLWNPQSDFLYREQTPLQPGATPEVGALNIAVVSADSLISLENTAIAAVTRDDRGNVVVRTTDGLTATLADGKTYAIADDVGNGYIVDTQGNIAKTTAQEAHAAARRGGKTYDLKFRFTRGTSSYGFDEQQHAALSSFYQQMDNGEAISWKALSTARSDVISGKLEGADIDVAHIRFEAGGAAVPVSVRTPESLSLEVAGKAPGIEEELLALYRPADTIPEVVVGKLNLATYEPIYHRLEIISVNGAVAPAGLTAETIARKLNDIYNQAVVTWEVTTHKGLQVDLPRRFDEGKTGLLANYTADMKEVINALPNFEDNTYYLFLIEEPRDPTTLGYMPRNKQAGFLFVAPHQGDADNFLKTIAHELGHGAFNLKHTFSEHPLAPGATDNLMDYSRGTALYKYQWDYIHEPPTVMSLFEDEGEASSVIVTNMRQLKEFANPDGTFTFLAPNGVPFTLPAETRGIRFWTNDAYADAVIRMDEAPDGALIAFTIGNETFRYHKVLGAKEGSGYKVSQGDPAYVDMLSKKQAEVARAIIGLPCVEGGKLEFIARQVEVYAPMPRGNHSAKGPVVPELPIEDPYALEYTSPKIHLEAELDFTYTQEALDFLSDNAACFNELASYAVKAADVIQRHPGYYTRYKKCGRYEMKYPHAGETDTEKAWLLGQYYEELKAFPTTLLNYIEHADNASEQLLTIDDPGALGELLAQSCESDFRFFTAEQRVHILRVLAQGNLQDYWLGAGNDRENIVVYTLRQAPADQYSALLDILAADRYGLLKTLVSRCDNQLVGEDNFDRLIDAVTVMIQQTSAYDGFERDIRGDRIVRWGAVDGFTHFRYNCGAWLEDAGAERIAFHSATTDIDVSGAGEVTGVHFSTTETAFPVVEAAPFDYVALKLHGDVTLSNGRPILRRSAGEFQAVPAIYLYWMIRRKATDETLTRIRANVNLLLFVVGGAEVIAARTGLRLALAITDQAMFATAFTLEAGLRRALEEGANGEEWAAVFSAFDAFNALYGVARIGQGLSVAASDIIARRDLVRRLRDSEDWNRFSPAQRSAVHARLDQIETKLDELKEVTTPYAVRTTDQLTGITIATDRAADIPSMPNPSGKFRQLISRDHRTWRAADFWNHQRPTFRLITSNDGKYLIKHDPETGRVLFVDVKNKQFIGFGLDEDGLIADDYETLLLNLKTIHGLPGGAKSITIRGRTIHFEPDKANFLLGKYKPNSTPGISGEIGTDDIINELRILKNYSFADESFSLRPGSVHILNTPEEMPIAEGKDFFDMYNKDFLDLIVRNKDEVNVVLVSDPRKIELLRIFSREDSQFTRQPTTFAKELRYLSQNGSQTFRLADGTVIRSVDIELDRGLSWTDWKY